MIDGSADPAAARFYHTYLQCLILSPKTLRVGTIKVCVTRRFHLYLLLHDPYHRCQLRPLSVDTESATSAAARITGLPERELRDIAQTDVDETRDNLLFSTLIGLCHHTNNSSEWEFVKIFAEVNIQHTLPRIQHDFCALWNEFVDRARIRGDSQSTSIRVLNLIRQLYLSLHQGTVTAPAALSSTSVGFFMIQPSLYPQCNAPDHRHRPYSIGHASVVNSHALPLLNQPDYSLHLSPHRSAFDGIIILRRTKQEGIDTRPRSLSEPTTAGEIAKSS